MLQAAFFMVLVPSLMAAQLFAAPLFAAQLFTANNLAEGTLYSDQVARQVGDLITINISERTAISEDKSTETSRGSSATVSGTISPVTAEKRSLPGITFASEKDFEGEGKYSEKGSVSATVTGRVIDRLDNGNLLIEARRGLQIGDNGKTIILTGIIRQADIATNNTVKSEKMHNFQLAIEGEGPLTRAQQEGLLSRLLDFIWPL